MPAGAAWLRPFASERIFGFLGTSDDRLALVDQARGLVASSLPAGAPPNGKLKPTISPTPRFRGDFPAAVLGNHSVEGCLRRGGVTWRIQAAWRKQPGAKK